MDLYDDARALQPDLARFRRELHADPEVGLVLPRTQDRVLEALRGLPLEITTGRDTTSITGVLRGAEPGPTVLLRADMDALPVVEENHEHWASTNGAMHACGHDLHTASLVGAAQLLCAHRDHLAGDVVFMFQPGEEGFDGAGVMLAEGLLECSGRRPDHAYALHVFSNRLPGGTFLSRPGVMMSASHGLDVTVRGEGGHGSNPHTARDPIVAAADMITSLQTMVTRNFDAQDPVVVTVGVVQAGTRRNVIPDTAYFEATIRTLSDEHAALLPAIVSRVLNGIADAHGVQAEIRLSADYPLTVNDADEVGFARGVVAELFGDERYVDSPRPVSGSEDFSRVLQAVPGAFLGLGACPPDHDPTKVPMNHSPRALFDDGVLADAAAVYASLATARLTGRTT